MGSLVSKGQGHGQVKLGHQMKMLHDYRETHILWVIWDAKYDGGRYMLIFRCDPWKGQYGVKLGQIRSNLQN